MNDDDLHRLGTTAHKEAAATTDPVADLALVRQRIVQDGREGSTEDVALNRADDGTRWMLLGVAATIVTVVVGVALLFTRDSGDSFRTAGVPTTTTGSPRASSTTSDATGRTVASTAVADVEAPIELIGGWRETTGLPDQRSGLAVTAAADSGDAVVIAVCDSMAGRQGGDDALSMWRATHEELAWKAASRPSTDRCPTQIEATAFGFFATGPGIAWRSADGMAWREWSVDGDASATGLGTYSVFPSPDGSRVTVLQIRAGVAASSIARMWTTTDGTDWHTVTEASTAGFDNSTISGVTEGGDGLLAFGASPGGESTPTAAVFTSLDGTQWRRVTPSSDDFRSKRIADVIRSESGFVAVGGDEFTTGLMTAWTSPDGISWTRSPHPPDTVDPTTAFLIAERATESQGQFWAVGTDFDAAREPDTLPALWVSDTGAEWNRVDIESGGEIVPFEVTTTDDVALAIWPPDPRLSDAPLQIFTRTKS